MLWQPRKDCPECRRKAILWGAFYSGAMLVSGSLVAAALNVGRYFEQPDDPPSHYTRSHVWHPAAG